MWNRTYKAGGAPSDNAAGQVQQGKIGIGALLPTGQNPTKPMEPTVGPFDHPTPGLEAGLPFDRLGFLAPRPDMGRIVGLLCPLPNLLIVVAFIQAEMKEAVPEWGRDGG